MGEVDRYEPLLKQLRWKTRDVLITSRQNGRGGRMVWLQGPYGQQAVVRVGADAGDAARYTPALEHLRTSGEPGVVPFVWAALGESEVGESEVGFLAEARPPVQLHRTGQGLGLCLLQLLGILQTLRDAGVQVSQLCPGWLAWDSGALPRLVDLRWLLTPGRTPAGYWTHPDLLRGPAKPQFSVEHSAAPLDTAVWAGIQLALARFPAERGAAELNSLLATSCALPEVLAIVFRVIGLPEIADGEPVSAGSPSRVELPQWTYSPSSASKSPASRRRFTSVR